MESGAPAPLISFSQQALPVPSNGKRSACSAYFFLAAGAASSKQWKAERLLRLFLSRSRRSKFQAMESGAPAPLISFSQQALRVPFTSCNY
jgi:hypothetical protein